MIIREIVQNHPHFQQYPKESEDTCLCKRGKSIFKLKSRNDEIKKFFSYFVCLFCFSSILDKEVQDFLILFLEQKSYC